MFPVLVRIDNRQGLLKPGMNAEVEVHVGERREVLSVPNAALRTPRDVASAAGVLGLDPAEVQKRLAAQASGGRGTDGQSGRAESAAEGRASLGAATRDSVRTRDTAAARGGAGGSTMTLRDGRTVTLPAGATEEQVRAALAKRRQGRQLTARESALLEQVMRAGGGGRGAGATGQGGGTDLFGGRYIVFVKRASGPEPVWIRTGLTDMDYSEVREGLAASDSVLILPSASLVQSQQEAQERINRMTGGGGLPGMRQQGAGPAEPGVRVEVQRGPAAPGNR
jgi:HlyD family secretion protein